MRAALPGSTEGGALGVVGLAGGGFVVVAGGLGPALAGTSWGQML